MSTTKWALDAAHSEVHFKVKHLMIATVTGSFTNFNANVESTDDSFTSANLHFEAYANSINTNNEQRDGHLKSPDFFNAEQFPTITIAANGFNAASGKLVANLTMMGVTKEVTFNVEFGGVIKDLYGQTKAGFTVEGKINRKDFGLSWNAAVESGGVVVSEEVKLQAEIQLVKTA